MHLSVRRRTVAGVAHRWSSRISGLGLAILILILIALASASPGRAAGVACPSPKDPSPAGPPLLAGMVLDTATGTCTADVEAAITPRAGEVLARRGVVLLGEVHDNAEHHALRGRLITRLATDPAIRSTSPILVFEHVRADRRDALVRVVGDPPHGRTSTNQLFAALDWADSGWPDAALFAPLYGPALASRWRMHAGDAAREDVRRVARQGLAAVPPNMRTSFRLDDPMPGPLGDDLLQELEDSHCGLMPRAAFSGMAVAQRYRDATLAAAAEAADGGAIVFAGNGHVRADRGVPFALRAGGSTRPVLVVMFVEVDGRLADAAAHLPRSSGDRPTADLVVFTTRADREDPCVAMRRAFEQRTRPGG